MKEKGVIYPENFGYLAPDKKSREARFYLLPKIHKLNCPGRPFCSTNNHPTKRISEFIDAHIKKYVQDIPTYIRMNE